MLPRSPSPRRPARTLALAALLLLGSCGLLQEAVEVPGKMFGAGEPPPAVPPSVVQVGVMRFADTFAAQIIQATQDFARLDGTPAGRVQAMSWSVGQTTGAFGIASGSNPHANLLDMIVLVSLGRMVHEEHWAQVWGEADRPMLAAYQKLEAEIWAVAAELLGPEQQEAVQLTLNEWRAQNPDVAVTSMVRLPTFQDLLAGGDPKEGMLTELTRLVSLDPLAGLEPTTREIEQTRLFAERTLYYLQRIQLILPIQAELLALRLTQQPAVSGVLDDTRRVSEAAASLADTAAGLPEAVRVEREAAIEQIARELEAQRKGLVADLEAAEEPAEKLLVEARSTLEAATAMSTALEGALVALDGFVGRFQKEEEPGAEPEPAPPPAEPGDPGEAGRPFDIADYGDAAQRIGVAANELTELVATLEQSLPEAQTLMDEAALRGEHAIDHAFRRGLVLGLSLIAAATLGSFLVRRWRAPSASGPASRP